MSEKSYGPVSLTISNLSEHCDLSNNAILLFLCHYVGEKFSVPLIHVYYTYSHHVSY